MVVSQPDLRRAVEEGCIAFDPPLDESQWGQASVDLRLGFSFTKLQPVKGMKFSVSSGLADIAKSGFWQTLQIKEKNLSGKRETFCLEPNEFILALTYGKITVPNNMIALVEGRSTYARVGLSMHQTAPWIQPGWVGPIVLEIMNNGPLSIELTPLIDKPCQLTFFQLSKELDAGDAYGSHATDVYQNQTHPIQKK
ncbi:MAG: dCTP deaminase [Candidatus Saccharimonadales bacterium]